MDKHHIYTFTDPESERVLYIGRTQNPDGRFRGHIKKLRRYVRHPFYCKLQSLIKKGYTKEELKTYFRVVISDLTFKQAVEEETRLINSTPNLLNIRMDGELGGDTFTNHPDKEGYRAKLKGRTPWNKGLKGYMGANRTSFRPGTILKRYRLTSPTGETFILNGQTELKRFCDEWNERHEVIWFRDPNWLSCNQLKCGKATKGWRLVKEIIETEPSN